jgi:chromosome partitioning protein
MTKLAFANQKGGVGKTTTTREIGFYLASQGFNTLFIDADPQGNLSKSIAYDDTKGLYEAMSGGDCQIQQIVNNLYLLPGESRLAILEKSLLGEVDVYTRLRDSLKDKLAVDNYDYILIDCPPSLGVITLNALSFADYVITPVCPALYSMQGTNDLLETVRKVQVNFNQRLEFLGININRYESRALIAREIVEEIKTVFVGKVFKTIISSSPKSVEEAISSRKGIVEMGTSKLKEQIIELGSELLTAVNAYSSV